jgi:hypothetical protein
MMGEYPQKLSEPGKGYLVHAQVIQYSIQLGFTDAYSLH